MQLVGIGDSVTRGFGSSSGHSYFEMLVRNPPDDAPEMRDVCLSKVFPSLEARNVAVNSTISEQHLRQVEQLPTADVTTLGWVVMTSGGNDVLHSYGRMPPREGAMYGATLAQARPWIESYRQRLEKMADTLGGKFPGGCEIFMATIYDPTDEVGDIENAGLPLPAWPEGLQVLAAANDAIRSLAHRRNVHVVDMRAAFLGHGIHRDDARGRYYHPQDPTYWFYTNLEDPNDLGYDAIRRVFLNAMAPVGSRLAR